MEYQLSPLTRADPRRPAPKSEVYGQVLETARTHWFWTRDCGHQGLLFAGLSTVSCSALRSVKATESRLRDGAIIQHGECVSPAQPRPGIPKLCKLVPRVSLIAAPSAAMTRDRLSIRQHDSCMSVVSHPTVYSFMHWSAQRLSNQLPPHPIVRLTDDRRPVVSDDISRVLCRTPNLITRGGYKLSASVLPVSDRGGTMVEELAEKIAPHPQLSDWT
ncbi:hypothetical protein RRG08_033488 [Elysia crispata]|uniref:Uncharacterized protein n=1 Tax=Elysia crispata TaxID=231223 RepID=A0AAE1ATX4_9GAST|nr:hypothetical protein RRG08_033488 [Elysia crispata]